MKPIHRLLLAAALVMPSHAFPQERVATAPSELAEGWARFVEVWAQPNYAAVAPLLSSGFSVSIPGGPSGVHQILADQWPAVRQRIGPLDAPTFFVSDGDRILEIGRTHARTEDRGGLEAEEYMCDPDPDSADLQPLTYWREWIRAPDQGWKVKAIVLR